MEVAAGCRSRDTRSRTPDDEIDLLTIDEVPEQLVWVQHLRVVYVGERSAFTVEMR
jgi:hypothetical protein